jgi:hypothetical protein
VLVAFAVACLATLPAHSADTELARYKQAEAIGKAHIAKFDRLDVDAFTNQKWDLFKESHSADTRIQEHPVKIANGEWTSDIGIMEGTFTEPMPTGKAFKLTMSTVGHWKNGTMDAEYLFWDNQTFMKQIGLSQ